MDQLFTVDTMQTQHVLDVLCGHLSLKDQFVFEDVNHQTRAAVRVRKFYQKLVELGSYIPDATTGRLVGQDGRLELMKVLTDINCENENDVETWEWNASLATLVKCRPRLKQLTLHVESDKYPDPPFRYVIQSADRNQMNHSAETLLAGLTFDQCTRLDLRFEVSFQDHASGLLPDLLKHFPALEHLALSGSILPLVSSLPAPSRLKTLELDLHRVTADQSLPPIIADFSGLESFTMLKVSTRHLSIVLTVLDNTEHPGTESLVRHINQKTGIDWLRSFERHPPVRLQHIALPLIADWILPLLSSKVDNDTTEAPPPCRSLTIHTWQKIWPPVAEKLRTGPVGRLLGGITHLTIMDAFRPGRIAHFLTFVPLLTVLELHLDQLNSADPHLVLDHQLPFLVKLMIYETETHRVDPAWIEQFTGKSPRGLDVIIKTKPDDVHAGVYY